MRQHPHKRSRTASKAVAIASALALGGGGIAVVAANASAGPGTPADRDAEPAARTLTVDCPDVGLALDKVPRGARVDVAKGLARLDAQVAEAYGKLEGQGAAKASDNGPVLDRLRAQRTRTIAAIADAIAERGAARPGALERMRSCDVKEDREAGRGDGQGGGGQGQQGGPVAGDFVDITTVEPNVPAPEEGENASTGTFTTECGTNEEGHFNSDNVIAAPGVSNGAHHVHDYVGNVSTDAFSTDESLAAADTTCDNEDRSTHYWPVLRALDGKQEGGHQPGGAHDGNIGSVLSPASVSLTFKGSPVSEVTEMPRFLRIITGDAKSFTNGTANANASWSCEGFEDRQLKDKYPLCPEGAQVVRTFNFQSCWDGQNTDSGNHRDHVAFARDDGSCPDGFRAIPQLQQRIAYDVPTGGGVPEDTPFAVDSFPEQLHKPVTDHGDFINVMPEELMSRAVTCINSNRDCD
ncbi:DUF1996 domain-containing protein [Streptomyces sp. NPDC054796]